jgi:gliding motility-associated-like protein
VFKAYNPNNYVKKIDIKIFNRWGKMVYQTNNPGINWDGRDKDTKKFLPSGVYYYICEVYETRLDGTQTRTLNGFVHLFYEEGAIPFNE